MAKRNTFSQEFKREAVRLLEKGNKSAAQLARKLGVRRNQLYKWKEEIDAHSEDAFPDQGRRPSQECPFFVGEDQTRIF